MYQPGIPTWSAFYGTRVGRLNAIQCARMAASEPVVNVPTWGSLADLCGPDAADALDILRDAIERGRYPDDTAAHVNAHRLAFARWLVQRNILTEYP